MTDLAGLFGPEGSPAVLAREVGAALQSAAEAEASPDAAHGLQLGAESFFEAAEILQGMTL